jgi:hypothetical protein
MIMGGSLGFPAMESWVLQPTLGKHAGMKSKWRQTASRRNGSLVFRNDSFGTASFR